ncbi:MAG: hypothetical protein AAGK00_00165 [Pseudomonadota bacterium]
MPARRFVIVCPPRTGSTYLTERLNSHPQIVCYGEILNAGGPYWHPAKQPDGFEGGLEEMQADPVAWIEANWSAPSGDAELVGFKMLERQALLLAAQVEPYFQSMLDLAVIFLDRSNVVERMASLRMANKTGVWQRYKNHEIPDGEKIKIEPKDMETYLKTEPLPRLFTKRMFAKQRQITLDYDTMVAEPEKHDAMLCDFLGVEQVALQSRSQKIASKPLSEYFEDFDGLRRHFQGTPFQHFFEVD